MTIKISQLSNISAVLGNVLFPTVANVAGTLTTVKANVSQVADYIIGNGNYTFGNVVPSANVTYNLGSPTAQWKDLYLSGNTIYFGGAQLSVANGSIQSSLPISSEVTATNLTVTGTQITFAQGAYIDETEILGLPGYYGLALNSSDDGIVGINALDSDANIATSVIASNTSVSINTNDSSNVEISHGWTFVGIGGTGVLMFPDFTEQETAFSQNYITAISGAESNIATLQSDVTTAQDDITNLQANAAAQADEIAAVAANVSASIYGDSNVASYLEFHTGNISASTITTDGLEIGGNYSFTTDAPNLATRQTLVANASSQLEWVAHFGQEEFDELIVTYIPNYPGNANAFVQTPTRVEAREWILAPNIFAANLTSIDSFYVGNIRFFDGSQQTTSGTEFTMANITHWTTNVTTISDALNQLAERIWNLENP